MTEKNPPDQAPNQAQAKQWNSASGPVWVELQTMLDELFQPFSALLVDQAVAAGGTRVLDVGCGAGGSTLAVASALGARSWCTGIDISAPLITAARARAAAEGAANVTFIEGDGQTHAFPGSRFDTVISRLGVMFFDDPEAAFANLRRAARQDARLAFIAWRSREENPFMTAAARAAAPIVEMPVRGDGSPGQFAFASDARVRDILQASGWTSIEVRAVDIPCRLPLTQLPTYVTRMGPYGGVRNTLDDPVMARADSAVIAAFDPFVVRDEVRFTSACWLVTAVG